MNVDGEVGGGNEAGSGAGESEVLSSNGDGYYYVKLIDKTDAEVNYHSLKIDFTRFDEMVEELYKEGKGRSVY